MRFKDTLSATTPDFSRRTTLRIHRAGVADATIRLQQAGLAFIDDPERVSAPLPPWAFCKATGSRRRPPHDLIIRFGDAVEVPTAIFASVAGLITTAVERSVSRYVLADGCYLALVWQPAPILSWLRLDRVQSPLTRDDTRAVGIRTQEEIYAWLAAKGFEPPPVEPTVLPDDDEDGTTANADMSGAY